MLNTLGLIPEELDEKSLSIVQFIQVNPGCTFHHVSKAMEKNQICADMTSTKRIKNLIEAGVVEDRRSGNSFHRLFINEKNEFNRIYKQLVAFDKVINEASRFVAKVLKLYNKVEKSTKKVNQKEDKIIEEIAFDILNNFMIPIGRVGNFILHFLLFQTFENVKNENYRRILNDKIVYLMLITDSVSKQIRSQYIPTNYISELKLFLNDIDRRDKYLKYDINISLVRSSSHMITDFINEFLPNSENKLR